MMMANERERVPLSVGNDYHYNVIYNYARCPKSENDDTKLSRKITLKIVRTLDSLGLVSYYHERDARLGGIVFDELIRVVQRSDYTIVVLTPGFVANSWKKYIQQTSLKTLLDKGLNHKFIPLSVGLSADELPQELTIQNVVYFQREWEGDETSWDKLKKFLTEHPLVPVPEQRIRDLPEGQAIQESGAHGLNRPDESGGEQDDTFEPERRANGNDLNHQYAPSSYPEVNQTGTNDQGRFDFDTTNQSTAADRSDPRPGGYSPSGASNPHAPTRHTTSEPLTNQNNVDQARSTSRSNEGIYSGVSTDLERHRATEHGRVSSQAGQTSESTYEGEHAHVTPDEHEDPGTDLFIDGDPESLIVNRLGGVGISQYRSELASGNSQTHRKYVEGRRDDQNHGRGVQNLGQGVQNIGQVVQKFGQEARNHGNSSQIQTTSGHAEDEEREIVNEEDVTGGENTGAASDYHSTESSSSSYVYSGGLDPESLRLQSLCGNAGGDGVGDAKTPLSPLEDSGIGTRSVSSETNSSSGVNSLVSTPEEATSETLNKNISGIGSKGVSQVASFSHFSSSDTVVETSREVQRVPDETNNSNSMSQTSTNYASGVTEESGGRPEGFKDHTHSVVPGSDEERAPPVESDSQETTTPTSVVSAVETGQDDTPTPVNSAAGNIGEEVLYHRTMNTNSEGPENITRPTEAGTGVRRWILPVLGFLGHALLKPDPFYL